MKLAKLKNNKETKVWTYKT